MGSIFNINCGTFLKCFNEYPVYWYFDVLTCIFEGLHLEPYVEFVWTFCLFYSNREAAPVMPPSPVSSPRTRASARLQTPTTPTPAADPYPKIPRLSPKHRRDDSPKHLKEEPIESDTPTRRMTRHSYANEIQRQSETPSGESKKGQGSEVKRKEPKRSRLSLSLSSSRSSTVSSTTASLSQRVTPPPPLLIPNIISSKCVESRNAPSVKSQQSTPIPLHNGLEGSESDGGLNDVLCWKIIPDEVYAQTPTPPSIIYGAPHLLRLFGE